VSNLTDQECAAGVSRRALETLRHSPNGQKPPAKPAPAPRRVKRRVAPAPPEIELRRVGPPPRAVDFPAPIELPPGIAEPIKPEPGSLAEHLAKAKESAITTPQKIAVLDTWDRSLDILNIDGWSFRIRDTHHLHKIQVDEIALDRVALEMLGKRISEALAQKGMS
jgi:hypothetical protein